MNWHNSDKFIDWMDAHPFQFVAVMTITCVLAAAVIIAVGGMTIQFIGGLFK